MVEEITKLMAYYCAARGNSEGTAVGKLAAVKFYHEQWMGC